VLLEKRVIEVWLVWMDLLDLEECQVHLEEPERRVTEDFKVEYIFKIKEHRVLTLQ
jgi:hypothetical protein